MGGNSRLVTPARGDDDNDDDIPMCESPISTAISPYRPATKMVHPLPAKPAVLAQPSHPLPVKPAMASPETAKPASNSPPTNLASMAPPTKPASNPPPTKPASMPPPAKPLPEQASPENSDQEQTESSSSPPPPEMPPLVTSVVPASFVPIETDWSQPLEVAGKTLSKSEHARIKEGALNYYRTGVRKGIVYLTSLDQTRISLVQAEADRAGRAAQAAREERARQLQRAQAVVCDLGIINPEDAAAKEAREAREAKEAKEAEEAANTLSTGYSDYIPPVEMDDMISAMCAPADPDLDYNVSTEAMKSVLPIQFPVPALGERPGGRRDHVRRYNEVAEHAFMQLGGYDVHMRQQRDRWMVVEEQEGAAQAAYERDAVSPPPPPPPPPPRPAAYPPLRDPALRKIDVDMSDI